MKLFIFLLAFIGLAHATDCTHLSKIITEQSENLIVNDNLYYQGRISKEDYYYTKTVLTNAQIQNSKIFKEKCHG